MRAVGVFYFLDAIVALLSTHLEFYIIKCKAYIVQQFNFVNVALL